MLQCLMNNLNYPGIREPTFFDIRLDNDILWLPTDQVNTTYGHFRGKVILCLNHPICVQDVKLHLEGLSYINWDPAYFSASRIHYRARWKESPFYRQTWSFLHGPGNTSSTILQRDNYEFPFEICLPARMAESVEGIDDCFIRYCLRAQIYTGNGKTISISRSLSVRKMYDMFQFYEPCVIEKLWPEKVAYEVNIPHQGFLLGSKIPIDFRFVPLLKGLTLSSVTSKVVETHTVKKPLPTSRSRIIVADGFNPDAWENMDKSQDGIWYLFSRVLQLPSSTRDCLLSAQTTIVQIQHKLEISIALQNPDGHTSAINLFFPLIFDLPQPMEAYQSIFHELGIATEEESPLPHYNDHFHHATPESPCSTSLTISAENPEFMNQPKEEDIPPEYEAFEDRSMVPSYSAAIQASVSQSYSWLEGRPLGVLI